MTELDGPEPKQIQLNPLFRKSLRYPLVTYHTTTLVQQAVQRNICIRSTFIVGEVSAAIVLILEI